MFLVDPDDIIAIHRANDLGGRDTAIAEVRRRWPALADRAVAGVLDRVLRNSSTSGQGQGIVTDCGDSGFGLHRNDGGLAGWR